MGKLTGFNVALAGLSQGKHSMEFHLGKQFFADMESSDIQDADLDARLEIDFSHGVYALSFDIAGTVTLTCDRCLGPLQWPVDTVYSLTVKYGDERDDSADGVLVLPQSEPSLDIAPILYETVELEIPLKHVHDEGACDSAMTDMLERHSAALPDGDGPVDPRWNELKKLTDNN